MDITNEKLEQLLSQGRGVYLADCGPLFLANDGSVTDNGGTMVLPPDPARAAIAARFTGANVYTLPVAGSSLGGVKNGGNVVVGADGAMSVAAAGDALGLVKNGGTVNVAADGTMSLPGIIPLVAIAAAAPESPADGDKYGNTTDGKVYVAASGTWAEATGADAAAAGILYAVGGLFYHWNETDGFALI